MVRVTCVVENVKCASTVSYDLRLNASVRKALKAYLARLLGLRFSAKGRSGKSCRQ